jgi:HNH endonuclease
MFRSFLAYSMVPHTRRHGPSGYVDYQSFKPWLRDEFTFCCVFCLLRERWCGLEADSFGVEHLSPRSRTPELELSYENLFYACAKCNSTKTNQFSLLNPCAEGYGIHLLVNRDGTVEGRTRQGKRLIRALRLNREQLLRVRCFFIDLAAKAEDNPSGEAAEIMQ